MAIRKTPFAIDEWYHCYNRGVDKRTTYEDRRDYHRFLEQLYLANSETPLRRDDIGTQNFEKILRVPRSRALVSIGAFCLMPNHFHLVLKEVVENGITTFMQKLGTAYTMYFNKRYERTGNLFVKPFRSRHVDGDDYLQYLVNYVHCNPAELYEPKWKTGNIRNLPALTGKLIEYPYSSLGAYEDSKLPARALLDENIFDVVRITPVRQMIHEAKEYYSENPELF
ncbi:MAG: transposase [Patescibacteria group bacterium]